MAQRVSVPEKTLEHWASQYVMYRTRSQASLWWPATGQDVDVRMLPAEPGKAVQLELKTATPAGTGLQIVHVDIGQLWEYSQKPLGEQPFYAFPWPDWAGNLDAVARAQMPRKEVTDLAFRRSGSGWWFGDWMVVLTTRQVAEVLGPELAAHPHRKRGCPKQLVQIDVSGHLEPVWGDPKGPAANPGVFNWTDFWSELLRCGRDDWPQLFRLPRFIIDRVQPTVSRGADLYPRGLVAEMLLRAARALGEQPDDHLDLVTLEPDGEGNYRILEDLSGGSTGSGSRDDTAAENDTAAEPDDHRQAVFLPTRALLL